MRKVTSLRAAFGAATVVPTLLLSACGGRSSHPVEATTAHDAQLSCDHLHAERRVNDARIADLDGERKGDSDNNVGKVIGQGAVGILFLDLSDSEKKEIQAFQARNKVLDQMVAERCPAPETAASGAARQP
jgi:hypothetical protein